MDKRNLLKITIVAGLATLAMTEPAFAQGATGSNWWDPVVSFLELLAEGFGKIFAIALGLGLVVYGGWGAFTGRLDPQRGIMMVIGGILVTAGPAIASGLLGVLK
jgi:type IV secretory pathway VirB2 component (pilin)